MAQKKKNFFSTLKDRFYTKKPESYSAPDRMYRHARNHRTVDLEKQSGFAIDFDRFINFLDGVLYHFGRSAKMNTRNFHPKLKQKIKAAGVLVLLTTICFAWLVSLIVWQFFVDGDEIGPKVVSVFLFVGIVIAGYYHEGIFTKPAMDTDSDYKAGTGILLASIYFLAGVGFILLFYFGDWRADNLKMWLSCIFTGMIWCWGGVSVHFKFLFNLKEIEQDARMGDALMTTSSSNIDHLEKIINSAIDRVDDNGINEDYWERPDTGFDAHRYYSSDN